MFFRDKKLKLKILSRSSVKGYVLEMWGSDGEVGGKTEREADIDCCAKLNGLSRRPQPPAAPRTPSNTQVLVAKCAGRTRLLTQCGSRAASRNGAVRESVSLKHLYTTEEFSAAVH